MLSVTMIFVCECVCTCSNFILLFIEPFRENKCVFTWLNSLILNMTSSSFIKMNDALSVSVQGFKNVHLLLTLFPSILCVCLLYYIYICKFALCIYYQW